MQKTTNFNLNKPESTDPMRVSDFNENADKIDAALGELTAGMPKIVCGTYTGNGAASRTIELGFTPKAVLVVNAFGQMWQTNNYKGGLAIKDCPVTDGTRNVVEVVENGFCVFYDTSETQNIFTNANNVRYHYLAIG